MDWCCAAPLVPFREIEAINDFLLRLSLCDLSVICRVNTIVVCGRELVELLAVQSSLVLESIRINWDFSRCQSQNLVKRSEQFWVRLCFLSFLFIYLNSNTNRNNIFFPNIFLCLCLFNIILILEWNMAQKCSRRVTWDSPCEKYLLFLGWSWIVLLMGHNI